MMASPLLPRGLPKGLEPLSDLVLDLRWNRSRSGTELWINLDQDLWERTRNPWVVLQNVSEERLQMLAENPTFKEMLQRLVAEREACLNESFWCEQACPTLGGRTIAYFSMEFGLGEGLPLYAGGLGVLAGDVLKTASDLGVPMVGVGLLYQEGYFRQIMNSDGSQQEAYPYNEPASLPIEPMLTASGEWMRIPLHLPGRKLWIRVWQVRVGRVSLYLLDSNSPLNSPADRGITAKLYGGGVEMRLRQEAVLGIGGWRALQSLGIAVDVCHLNEGHAAFVVLERARTFMHETGTSFREALWATRSGNVFTTHTPVAAGFDGFTPDLLNKYFPYFSPYLAELGISFQELLSLGRENSHDPQEPFNMAYLAMRGCSHANAVSQRHQGVSRRIFESLYPRWPESEVPIDYVTNGIHVPSWDSPWSDELWAEACGKARWLGTTEALTEAIQSLSDEALWNFCAEERRDLVHYARTRLAIHLGQRGADATVIAQTERILDPNALSLGFARRFTEYKRPNLLLHDPERFARILANPKYPVQIIVAGKAHPDDSEGKRLIQEWFRFMDRPEVRTRMVFLEDYDIALAQQMVQGVDVWINTPRPPWEACGTSGMKVLVNGGLNLSELDGWWAEAYSPALGWAVGTEDQAETGSDALDADRLYRILEEKVIPLFYDRDHRGIPCGWVSRIRASMARLTPQFSSNRMLREYVERLYRPAAESFQRRTRNQAALAKELHAWYRMLHQYWHQIHFGELQLEQAGGWWVFKLPVYLGDITREAVQVELYAESLDGDPPLRQVMEPIDRIAGSINGYVYQTRVSASRPESHFTPRVIPYHPEARVPTEASMILWLK